MKKTQRKLVLRSERVVNLSAEDMTRVAGGGLLVDPARQPSFRSIICLSGECDGCGNLTQ